MTRHDDTVYLRHILDAIQQIEAYLHLDLESVWDTAKSDLPALKEWIASMLR